MSTTHAPGKSVPTGASPADDANSDTTDVPNPRGRRFSKDSALSDREYQLLLEGAGRMDDYQGQQARFCILVMGRLGLRRAELAHLRRSWVDDRRMMITIPRHQPCEKGRGGGKCGDCRLKSQQEADHNPDVSFEQALAKRWKPKTDAAAREVPYGFDPRVELVVERFLDRYDGWPLSAQTVNRRVKTAAEHADELSAGQIFPHCLRASAATYHANRGLDALPLQALMGWKDLKTAQHYVATSGENTARALQSVHAR